MSLEEGRTSGEYTENKKPVRLVGSCFIMELKKWKLSRQTSKVPDTCDSFDTSWRGEVGMNIHGVGFSSLNQIHTDMTPQNLI